MRIPVALLAAALLAGNSYAEDKPNRIERAAKRTADGVEKTAKRTGRWAERTATRAGKAVGRTAERTENWIKRKLD
jgi:hypothetical protein